MDAGGRRYPGCHDSVYADVQDWFAFVVPTIRTDSVRNLVVAALRARVHGHVLCLDVGAALTLALF